MGLGMKNDFSELQSPGLLDECFECDAPQSMFAMGSHHRHATDARAAVAQRQKPTGGQGALGIRDEQVSTDRIEFVPLILCSHALLLHEDGLSNGCAACAQCRPVIDREGGGCRLQRPMGGGLSGAPDGLGPPGVRPPAWHEVPMQVGHDIAKAREVELVGLPPRHEPGLPLGQGLGDVEPLGRGEGMPLLNMV